MASAILAAGAVLLALFILAHGANRALFDDGYLLSLDHDQSISAWATSALFTLAGAACALLAWLDRPLRGPFAALAAIAFGLSMEQVVQVHGRVEESLSDSKAIEVVLGLAVAAVIVVAALRLRSPFRLLLLSAIAAMAISALASQANQGLDLPHAGVVFFQTIEEAFESVTAILILAAVAETLWAAVARRGADSLAEADLGFELVDDEPR